MDYPDVTNAARGEHDAESESLPDYGGEPRHWSDCYRFPDRKSDLDDLAEHADVDTEDQSSLVGGDHEIDVDADDAERRPPPPQSAEGLPPGGCDEHPWFQQRWNDCWAVPNVFLRGSLFAGVRATHRTLNNTVMASQGDFTVVATGKQLTQSDLDVWSAVVNLENGNRVDVSCHTLLRHLDRHDGSSDRAWLLSALKRLHQCHVMITFKDGKRKGYTGLLIKELRLRAPTSKKPTAQGRKQKDTTNQIEALIDPAIAHLFEAGWTYLPTSRRRWMRMKPLANWLTAFYQTHREPVRIKVDTLRRFSGSTGRSSAFKKRLDEDLRFVEAAGYFAVATIVGDLVEVVRCPFSSGIRQNPGGTLEQARSLPFGPTTTTAAEVRGGKVAISLTTRIRRFLRAVRAYLTR